MTQQFITSVVPFDVEPAPAERLLERWGNPALLKPGANAATPGQRIAQALDRIELIHFMGIHVIRGNAARHHLVFELSVDDSPTHVLEQLEEAIGPELEELLECMDQPAPGSLKDFLLAYRQLPGPGLLQPCGLDFCGTPGFSVKRIRREHALAARLREALPRLDPQLSPLQKLDELRSEEWSAHTLRLALVEPAQLASGPQGSVARAFLRGIGPALRELLWPALLPPLFAAVALALYFSPWLAVLGTLGVIALELLLGFWAYRKLRRLEDDDVEDVQPEDAQKREQLLDLEDRTEQNHLIVLTDLKPGWLRRFTLRLAFLAVRQGVRDVFAKGQLSDIATIHFARWLVLPNTSQLVFFSNYGGSWQSYLEDFIIKAHEGLTAIWSNTQGFPRARNLFQLGATNGPRFKAWARRYQQPTRFWYSAYPDLPIARIRANAAQCRGLATVASERDAAQWFALFGAPSPTQLNAQAAPALALHTPARMDFGRCLLYRFADEQRLCAWLADVGPRASYGEHPGVDHLLQLGLSASGLSHLQLGAATYATFPIAFQQGSARRARILGDEDQDAPDKWVWGGNETPVDAVLLVYGHDALALQRELNGLAPFAQHCFHEIDISRAPGMRNREHFGFVDGISQPKLKGMHTARTRSGDAPVAAGEFLLGYPDETGAEPPSPRLISQAGSSDLGLNGTFLVVRQLEQHVDAFNAYIARQAQRARAAGLVPHRVRPKDWIKAKLIGRWPNGSSLVRYPTRPGPNRVRDNDFSYGPTDRDGLACPLGAHIRRANPRDSFEPDAADPTKVVNRHRILRVGRSYTNGNERGLLFICLNADLERQFEFVQQTWLRGRSFSGLPNELDPLQTGSEEHTIPTVHGPFQLTGMRQFVSVRGSAYFFVPGREALRQLTSRAERRMLVLAAAAAAE